MEYVSMSRDDDMNDHAQNAGQHPPLLSLIVDNEAFSPRDVVEDVCALGRNRAGKQSLSEN